MFSPQEMEYVIWYVLANAVMANILQYMCIKSTNHIPSIHSWRQKKSKEEKKSIITKQKSDLYKLSKGPYT